jgi:hypothetical protein
MINTLRTFTVHLLVHMHQKKEIAVEITAKIARALKILGLIHISSLMRMRSNSEFNSFT